MSTRPAADRPARAARTRPLPARAIPPASHEPAAARWSTGPALERELAEMRMREAATRADEAAKNVRSAFGLMKAFYDAPRHRLALNQAIRAAASAGYNSDELEQFRAGQDPPLRRDEEGFILTLRGTQWYERCLAVLMSRPE